MNKSADNLIPYLYIGKITNILDPKKRGRVRVRIMGLISDDILDDLCPWVEQGATLFSGTETTSGTSSIPQIGSLVWIAFAYGDQNRPVYLGYARGASDSSQLQKVDDLSNTISAVRESNIIGPELSPLNSQSVYPLNNVIETSSKNVIELDDTPGNERIDIAHNTGSYIEIRPDGTIQIKSVEAFYEIIKTNVEKYIGGNKTETVENACELNVNASRTHNIADVDTFNVGSSFIVSSPVISLN
jgi:uncharacterized protein involved in type VI secretion and phage assembly